MSNQDVYLGIHAGHDANVTVMDREGQVLFASGEERFNRVKMYAGFPSMALKYAMENFGENVVGLAAPRMRVTRKVIREFGFLMNSFTHQLAAPRFGIWFKAGFKKLVQGRTIEKTVPDLGIDPNWPVANVEHHHAHAGGAFYHSGFSKGYVMTLDGEGDGYSCCFYRAGPDGLKRFKAFYHNEVTIGRDYEKVTAMLGFHPLRHPGKITGLAAYGTENPDCVETLEKYLLDSWKTSRYQIFVPNPTLEVISEAGCEKLRRDREEKFGNFSREDISWAIQHLTEEKVLGMIRKWIPDYEGSAIALSGGVFANVALNKKIKDLGFKEIFIMPAMSDAGLSLGALLYSAPNRRGVSGVNHVCFGPSYSPDEIRGVLDTGGVKYESPSNIADTVAQALADGKVVARFDGAMEYGPRALGNRSILYHTGDPTVNDWLNTKLKRTEFMPFAPVTLARFARECYLGFDGAERTAKFMTITFDCTDRMKKESPAVVHVDGTARPQVIHADDNPGYAAILESYYKLTGIPSVVNTSFNMHEEPIVMTPDDALRAFTASELDLMAMGPFVVRKQG